MSYRGRPSKGCEGCRARKVKCDEAKPVCGRCSKKSLICRYRDQADVLFRNQTELAAQRAESSWRQRSKSYLDTFRETSASPGPVASDHSAGSDRDQQLTSDSVNQTSSLVTQTRSDTLSEDGLSTPFESSPRSSIAPYIRQDMRQLAYERFIYDFVASENPSRPPGEPSDALFSFLPVLYQHAHPDSCLASVVNAVAYINFANRCDVPLATTLAEESFGKGIKLLSKMITDKEAAASNDALCSVHLMGIFETLTSFQRQGTFTAHQHGANALLQLRTAEQYYSNTISARLYEVAYAQMLLASLQAAKLPSLPVQDTPSVRQSLPSLYNKSDTFVVQLIWRAAELHAIWHGIKHGATPLTNRSDLQGLLQNALNLDVEFESWALTLPSAWKYDVKPNTPEVRRTYSSKWQKLVLASKGAPVDIHTYTNLKRCSIWSYYRTSRLFLVRDLLEILNWMWRLPLLETTWTSQQQPMDSAHGPVSPNLHAIESPLTSLADHALESHYALTATRLVKLLEEICSSILGSFTVAMYKKSLEDVMGLKGHIVLWPLGTMDSVLSSGLVPDSNTTPASSRTGMPQTDARPVEQVLINSFYHDTSMATTEHGFTTPTNFTPANDTNEMRSHPFDSVPRHPYDSPPRLPTHSMNLPELKTLDVAAKREWLNSILYYIGTELGIKKALAVPVMEGYLPIVKRCVDEILGR